MSKRKPNVARNEITGLPKPREVTRIRAEDVPRLLRQYRSRYCVTQEEVARFLGVSPRTIIRWEHGIVKPLAAHLRVIYQMVSRVHIGE